MSATAKTGIRSVSLFFCCLAVDRASKSPLTGHYYTQWWPRPLQISQWTMASARGHPVMLDTVRRVVEMALEDKNATSRSVMERTGPGQSSSRSSASCTLS